MDVVIAALDTTPNELPFQGAMGVLGMLPNAMRWAEFSWASSPKKTSNALRFTLFQTHIYATDNKTFLRELQTNLGKKIKKGTKTDIAANNKTAPALISFAAFINGCFSVETLSQSFSMAVFINSADSTEPIHNTMATHSKWLICNTIPKTTATTAASN